MTMESVPGNVAEVALNEGRRFRSPQRILVRSFRISRDKWRQKHHAVQADLEQTRQRAAERGASRDRWRERCEAAEARVELSESLEAQRLAELAQARARVAELEAVVQKKTR
jgi:hypothetical protein